MFFFVCFCPWSLPGVQTQTNERPRPQQLAEDAKAAAAATQEDAKAAVITVSDDDDDVVPASTAVANASSTVRYAPCLRNSSFDFRVFLSFLFCGVSIAKGSRLSRVGVCRVM